MAGMLYLVPTPIGNLGDISVRCRQTLEQADFIAAEAPWDEQGTHSASLYSQYSY